MRMPSVLRGLASVAAFLVPGLALWLPSGYSYGAALVLLGALVGAPWWWRECRVSAQSRWLLLSIVLMGSVWLLDSSTGAWRWGGVDRPSKYLLALPCLFFLLAFAPNPRYLWTGIAVGALGGGAIAWYQVHALHIGRATGYTNAIQYGNLSMLLGLMCLIVAVARPPGVRRWHQVVLGGGMVAGFLGSVLSQSRGGWVALAMALMALVLVLSRFLPWRRLVVGSLVVLCMVSTVVFVQRQGIEQRVDAARDETERYVEKKDAVTSVGTRLTLWQMAWEMGLERPVLGWGATGYTAERQRRVDTGKVDPFVRDMAHTHNEVLDLFAKHGLLGVFALLLFYGVPLVIFWPTRARIMARAVEVLPGGEKQHIDRTALALYLVGWVIPLSYIGFGLTQVFFAHNSGNVFYLFMVMLVHSCLQAHQRNVRSQAGAPGVNANALAGAAHPSSDGKPRGE